jgi:hypothetical protein
MLVLCPLAGADDRCRAVGSSSAGRACPVRAVQPGRAADPVRQLFLLPRPGQNHRQAGLRLDIREAALAKGRHRAGKPEKSSLIARVFAKNDALLMPPTSAHKTLSSAQKNLLKRWIA